MSGLALLGNSLQSRIFHGFFVENTDRQDTAFQVLLAFLRPHTKTNGKLLLTFVAAVK